MDGIAEQKLMLLRNENWLNEDQKIELWKLLAVLDYSTRCNFVTGLVNKLLDVALRRGAEAVWSPITLQIVAPWVALTREGWRIVGMHHYTDHVAGRAGCLHVAMVNGNQQCITAEGIDTDAVWQSLRDQANALALQAEKERDPNLILDYRHYYVHTFNWDLFVKNMNSVRRFEDLGEGVKPVLDGQPYQVEAMFEFGCIVVRWNASYPAKLYNKENFGELCLLVDK